MLQQNYKTDSSVYLKRSYKLRTKSDFQIDSSGNLLSLSCLCGSTLLKIVFSKLRDQFEFQVHLQYTAA